MSWTALPDRTGVYYVRVYSESSSSNSLHWKYIDESEKWIKLQPFENNDLFKWKFDHVSGNNWRISPFEDSSIGMGLSATTRSDGTGAYWYHGFIEGKTAPSDAWTINASSKWSTISLGKDVLDSRAGTPNGRDAEGCVHLYDPLDGPEGANQRWVFQSVKSSGNTFEDLWFTLTPDDAKKEEYDIIVIGTGMGAGVVAGDLFDSNSKLGNKSKSVLVIEKGGVPFHSHCLNAARPGGFGEDRGQQNDTFFSLFKKNYTFSDKDLAAQWKAGQMFSIGGRGAVWGLFAPRIHDETLEKEFGTDFRQQLVGEWYSKAENLMGLFNPTTSSYHASLMERLNMVSKRDCQWQWGRIASEFKEEANFDFARGAYSPIDKLLEIAMSKDRDANGKTKEHPNFKILIHSDVRSLQLDGTKDDFYSGVWVRDLNGKDHLIKLKDKGKIVLGAGSVASPTILMRSSSGLANLLSDNNGLHLTDHDIFAATATFGYLDMSIQEKVGAMKLQTYVRLKKTGRVALLNIAVAASSFLPRTSYPWQQRYTNTEYPKMIAAYIFPESLIQSNTLTLDTSSKKAERRRNGEIKVTAGRRQPFNTGSDDKGDIADLRDLTKTVFKTIEDELKLSDMYVVDPEGAQIRVEDDKFFKALELGGVAHELGTIPMISPRKDQGYCLDKDLKLRSTTNVYVCDLSLFPFAPEVNPTLTLVALAMRLSRHILDPKVINTKGDDSVGSTLTTAQAAVRRWVMNQTGDPIKVYISNLSNVTTTKRYIDGKEQQDDATKSGETILEPGEILEVDRDNKTDETVRVYKLMFGIDWEKWKARTPKVPLNPFVTRPVQYIASPQKVCAIE